MITRAETKKRKAEKLDSQDGSRNSIAVKKINSDEMNGLNPEPEKLKFDAQENKSLNIEKNKTDASEYNPYVASVVRHLTYLYNPNRYKKNETKNGLGGIPQQTTTISIPAQLAKPENKKILQTILSICGDENGPFVIPAVIDHWTTFNNLKSIVSSGAFLGNGYMRKNKVGFIKNALSGCDIINLDGNVICFCPGGFVDPSATKDTYYYIEEGREERARVRIRIDLRKVNLPGQYNTFFKISDLCCPKYKINIKLTHSLSAELSRNNDIFSKDWFYLTFKFNGRSLRIALEKNDLIFYGSLAGINRFCLIFPFIALEKIIKSNDADNTSEDSFPKLRCDRKELPSLIYNHLRDLNEDELKKVLICLAQNLTMFSEYNFYAQLPLVSNLIYDIHVVSNNTTYALQELNPEEYNTKVLQLKDSFSAETWLQTLPNMKEDIVTERTVYHDHMLYGVEMNTGSSIFTYDLDVTKIKNDAFSKGYFETRVGNRNVPVISYRDFKRDDSSYSNNSIRVNFKK